MKLLDQISFKLTGRKVPVIRVSEVDDTTGLIRTVQLVGYCKDDQNRLINTWDNNTWEKTDGTNPISRISEKGTNELAWVVSERGQTVNLYTQPWKGPSNEGVLGAMGNVDIIRDVMALAASMRDKIIFMVAGIMIGWLFVGPMLTKAMS